MVFILKIIFAKNVGMVVIFVMINIALNAKMVLFYIKIIVLNNVLKSFIKIKKNVCRVMKTVYNVKKIYVYNVKINLN
jgi:hypothetical protein